MSKGFGRVQCALIDIFASIGERTYSIAELCELVYDQPDEKKHRVALLRAVRGVLLHGRGSKKIGKIGMFRGGYRWTYYFCDVTNLAAYALVQTRLQFGHTHEEAKKALQYNLEHPSDFTDVAKDMEPLTGLWWLTARRARPI